jgi:hypothetical protein
VVDVATRFDILSQGVIATSVLRSEIAPNDLLGIYRQAIREPTLSPVWNLQEGEIYREG